MLGVTYYFMPLLRQLPKTQLPSVGGVTPLLLTWRPHSTSGGLGIRRANYSNGRVSTWSAPRVLTPSESEVGGEWAIFSLSDGTVLLVSGMGGMVRSSDGGRSFSNVSTPRATTPKGSKPLADGGAFDCTTECGSWTVLELSKEDHGLRAGVFTFDGNSIWRSTDMARSFERFGNATGFAGRLPRGKDNGFFS